MNNFKLLVVALTFFALFSLSSDAQPKDCQNWQEKMSCEKIAFITDQLDLTPEEAQAFWPVYNKLSKEKMESQKMMMKSYHELMKALNENKASDKEIDALLDTYLTARQANKEFGKGDADKYREVLPSRKVAKLYVAEENFRRHHIKTMMRPQVPGHGRPDHEAGK